MVRLVLTHPVYVAVVTLQCSYYSTQVTVIPTWRMKKRCNQETCWVQKPITCFHSTLYFCSEISHLSLLFNGYKTLTVPWGQKWSVQLTSKAQGLALCLMHSGQAVTALLINKWITPVGIIFLKPSVEMYLVTTRPYQGRREESGTTALATCSHTW